MEPDLFGEGELLADIQQTLERKGFAQAEAFVEKIRIFPALPEPRPSLMLPEVQSDQEGEPVPEPVGYFITRTAKAKVRRLHYWGKCPVSGFELPRVDFHGLERPSASLYDFACSRCCRS